MNTLRDIRFTISVVSILAGAVALYHLFVQKAAEYVGPANETSSDPTSAPAKCMPVPVLDRLVCILAQNNIDPSKMDYGQSDVRDLTAFLVPLVFLLTVEASRVGNSGSLLVCMPFIAVVACLFGGGTYLLIFFAPLMNYSRNRIMRTLGASNIPSARLYAILVANLALIKFMPTAGTKQEGGAYYWALVLMGLLWFIYSPLTRLFEVLAEEETHVAEEIEEEIKTHQLVRDSFLFMGAVNVLGGSTPLWHIYNSYYGPLSLRWDLFCAIGASWLWVLSEAEGLAYQVFFILISVLFPGGGLMLFASDRELVLIDHVRSLSAKRAQ
ncbi:hypothetical protein BGX34_010235 [Mortierella sp. NVP85]|nr:hypothetical protein BGX34_010235 [Mortierella sp. NVP85]